MPIAQISTRNELRKAVATTTYDSMLIERGIAEIDRPAYSACISRIMLRKPISTSWEEIIRTKILGLKSLRRPPRTTIHLSQPVARAFRQLTLDHAATNDETMLMLIALLDDPARPGAE